MSNRGFSDDGIPLWTAWAMVGAGVVFMVGIALAAQAWRTPVTRETLTSRSDYTSAGSFAYQADVTPSILYPDGKIGPVAPGASSAEAPPIYLASNPKITVDFEYSFTSLPGSTAKVQGEVESELIVRVAEKGWTKVVSLGQPLSFTGPSVGVPLTVDVPAVQTLIAEIERETNFRPATYQLVVAPTVHVAGTLDGAPVNEVFSPEYTFVLDRAQVIGDSPQTFERPHTIQTRAQVGTSVPWPLVAVPTVLGRFLALGLVFAALLAFCATAAYSLVGVGRVESARIRARYGSMLVSVRDTKFDVDPQKQIRLQSIGDLVKLARKDARMILHHVAPGGTHVYFIQDSDVTYLYVGESAGASAAPALSQA